MGVLVNKIEQCANCQNSNLEIVNRPLSDGRPRFIYQCLDCGESNGSAIAYSYIVDTFGSLDTPPYFNEHLLEAKRQERYEERLQQHSEKLLNGLTQWQREANEYYRSPKWKDRRGKVLRRDGYVCQACQQNAASEVHHLTYSHWRNEPLFDLVAVCHSCHENITRMDRENRGIQQETQ